MPERPQKKPYELTRSCRPGRCLASESCLVVYTQGRLQ